MKWSCLAVAYFSESSVTESFCAAFFQMDISLRICVDAGDTIWYVKWRLAVCPHDEPVLVSWVSLSNWKYFAYIRHPIIDRITPGATWRVNIPKVTSPVACFWCCWYPISYNAGVVLWCITWTFGLDTTIIFGGSPIGVAVPPILLNITIAWSVS